jgi:hypothetical protein
MGFWAASYKNIAKLKVDLKEIDAGILFYISDV